MSEHETSLEPESESGGRHRKHREHRRHRRGNRTCPGCGANAAARSHRRGPLENFILPLVLHRPFHCHNCGHRFYGFSFGKKTIARWAVVFVTTGVVLTLAVGIYTGIVQSVARTALAPIISLLTG